MESLTINSTQMQPSTVAADNPANLNLHLSNAGDWVRMSVYVKNSAAPPAQFYNVFMKLRNAAIVKIILKDEAGATVDVLMVS